MKTGKLLLTHRNIMYVYLNNTTMYLKGKYSYTVIYGVLEVVDFWAVSERLHSFGYTTYKQNTLSSTMYLVGWNASFSALLQWSILFSRTKMKVIYIHTKYFTLRNTLWLPGHQSPCVNLAPGRYNFYVPNSYKGLYPLLVR